MTSLLKDLQINVYTEVNEDAQRILRYKSFRLIFNHWKTAQKEELYTGPLQGLFEIILEELEKREEYEACKCILETMYEYSARLD